MGLLTPLMSKAQVLAELNIGETGLSRLRSHNTRPFPEPVRLGLKLYWRRDEIEEYLKTFIPRNKGKP